MEELRFHVCWLEWAVTDKLIFFLKGTAVVCATVVLVARVAMTATGWQPEPSLILSAQRLLLSALVGFAALLYREADDLRWAQRVLNAVAAASRRAITAEGGGQRGSMP